jgi:hypothetical protein
MKRYKDVTIWIDESKEVVVAPDPVHISVKAGEQVSWECFQGDFEIQFKETDTPFLGSFFRGGQGGSIGSGPSSSQKTRERGYKYTVAVSVTLPNGETRRRYKDPLVVVEE